MTTGNDAMTQNRARNLTLVLTFAAALAACQRAAPPAQQAMPVVVANPLTREMVDWDSFSGRFEASRQVEVRARVGGYVQGVHFRDGQQVAEGQLLFTLDPRPAQAAAEAGKARAAQARADFERAQKLVAETAISQQEFDAAQATLASAESAATQSALDLEFTRVTAPMAGTVSYRRVDPGNIVSGGSSGGTLLTTVVATNPIYFVFDASEAVLLKYQRQSRSGRGAAVRVRLQDETEYTRNGTLDFADNAIDQGSGAVRLRAVIPNANNFIRPGMFGSARVVASAKYQAVLVPDSAITTNGAQKLALTVGADGSVTPKPVELGPLDGSLRVVRSGLTAQDLVIIDGVQRAAYPGVKVSPQKGEIKQTPPATPTAQPLAAPAAIASPAADVGAR
jgi:RND family efflux transporter MFP subunit